MLKRQGKKTMKIGDLVEHSPEGSIVESVLRQLTTDKIPPDFILGVVVEQQKKRSRVFSHQLPGVFWYDNTELKLIE